MGIRESKSDDQSRASGKEHANGKWILPSTLAFPSALYAGPYELRITNHDSRSAMRVIAGKYRSRTLRSLKGQALRPTSDRLRETLFNILGPTVEGATFVDLYAGTGAVGIEALSRGARRVIFVEQHAPAAALIRRNLEPLGIGAEAEILNINVARGIERLEGRHIHAQFIFLDPPYAADSEYETALEALGESPLLAPEGRVIVEHLKKRQLPERSGDLELVRVVEQGDAALSFYRLAVAA
jgi:16S rRNA (guanine(966)-N(2))-methyltransferase RsmD